tara:strand:+ start:583 stop:957 length:375 start_codon:yes stop_codon:yes gene_type:complete
MLRALLLIVLCSPAAALLVGVQHRSSLAQPSVARHGPLICQDGGDGIGSLPDFSPDNCDYKGCVDGRVMGGLGATWLFQWWPIKAYRPCPTCAENGFKYKRTGQSLDEIVFKKNPAGGYYGDTE